MNIYDPNQRYLSSEDVYQSIRKIAPKGNVVKFSKGSNEDMDYIELIDTSTNSKYQWINNKGEKQYVNLGHPSIKFLVSEEGDKRHPFVLLPDRGKVFFSHQNTFIYTIEKAVYTREEEEQLDGILRQASEIQSCFVKYSWKNWKEDIRKRLKYETKNPTTTP